MNNNNKLITDIDNKLSKKQWSFLQYIASGLKVTEAYKLAGYKGNNLDSAYLLNHRLKDRINEILVNNGFNRNNFMVEVGKLIDLPLRDDQKQVTIDQKVKILRLFKDSLPEQKRETSFTQFVISNGTIEAKHQGNSVVIDTKLESNDNEASNNTNSV